MATSDDMQAIRASLLRHAAGLEFDMGYGERADANVKAALAISRALDDAAGQADSLNLLGLLATDAERFDVAQNLFQKSLALRNEQEHHGRAVALHNLGRVATQRGNRTEALQLFQESLGQRIASGDAMGIAMAHAELGGLAFYNGEYDKARRLYSDSLAARHKLNDRLGIALMLYNLAEIAEVEGDMQRTIILFVHAQRIFRDLHSAFAGAAETALANLREKLGEATFEPLKRTAESAPWEDYVALPAG